MRAAGSVVHIMLEAMKAEVRPGITTRKLDEMARADAAAWSAIRAGAGLWIFPGWLHQSQRGGGARHHGRPGAAAGDLIKLDVR